MDFFEYLSRFAPSTATAGGFTTGVSSSALRGGVGVNSLNAWLNRSQKGMTPALMGQATHVQQQIWSQGWRRTS